MRVEFGNPNPTKTEARPAVTVMNVPETSVYSPAYPDDDRSGFDSADALAVEVMRQMVRGAASGVTHLPEQEAVFEVVTAWQAESSGSPTWVSCEDNDDFEVLLAAVFGCPRGRPADVEETHFTHAGPPGVGPAVAPEPEPAPEEVATEVAVAEEA